jgi:hypothetical protein
MSGELTITFARDMPAATVEVVSPDLEVVQRVMLDPGRSTTVQVPSEASFLRVHLPSGQVVTLKDPGNLTREVSLHTIQRRLQGSQPPFEEEPPEQSSMTEIRRYLRGQSRTTTPKPTLATGPLTPLLTLRAYGRAELTGARGPISGVLASSGREAQWHLAHNPQQPPLALKILAQSGTRLELRVPGNASRIWARADTLRDQSAVSFSVRIATIASSADTIASYLQRGDLYSAEAMAQWIGEAAELLFDKMEDPYAAAVGAYLLLRLKKFDEMHDWARNLASRFDFLPDGCVIWAWQLIHQQPSNADEIRKYLLMAVDRGLPVYSEGLRLLTDGLRLMGSDGQAPRDKVVQSAGVVLWSSPLTASLATEPGVAPPTNPSLHDIAFASEA